jgi:hypothetical protein
MCDLSLCAPLWQGATRSHNVKWHRLRFVVALAVRDFSRPAKPRIRSWKRVTTSPCALDKLGTGYALYCSRWLAGSRAGLVECPVHHGTTLTLHAAHRLVCLQRRAATAYGVPGCKGGSPVCTETACCITLQPSKDTATPAACNFAACSRLRLQVDCCLAPSCCTCCHTLLLPAGILSQVLSISNPASSPSEPRLLGRPTGRSWRVL